MSEKTIAEKLLLKPGRCLFVLNAPACYLENIGPFPNFSKIVGKNEHFDVLQLFIRSQADLEIEFPKAAKLVKAETIFWVCYPKKSGSIKTDLNRDILRAFAALKNWSGVNLISVNDDWSAMRFKPL